MTAVDRLVPSVADARRNHLEWAHASGYSTLAHPFPKLKPFWRCFMCRNTALRTEAASVALDMAVAAQHRPWRGPAWAVTVDQVAWA